MAEGPEPSSLPERPRLRPTVHARRHLVDGEVKLTLHEWRTGVLVELDEASWTALTLADGTRDLDALCLACAREGVYRGRRELRALLAALAGADLLADGLEAPAWAPPVELPGTPPERPLEPLPGFRLRCDGRGSCCRFYGSVSFGPREAMVARLWADEMELPLGAGELFTPLSGAQRDEQTPLAVAQSNGCCVFLDRDGGCGLHRRGGAEAKPFACRFYPTVLVDDGLAVRVSVGPECACVFASALEPGRQAEDAQRGEALIPDGARTLADLDGAIAVMHVPDPVPLSARRIASRAALHDWSARLVAALEGSEADALSLAWRLSRAVAREGLALGALEQALAAEDGPRPPELRRWLAALGQRAAQAADAEARWRSGSDLSRRVARWLADALADTSAMATADAPADGAAERFYLRALAHGHRLALEGRPLQQGLTDRATRILASRAMAKAAHLRPRDVSGPPLALLEAAMRNLRLTSYAPQE